MQDVVKVLKLTPPGDAPQAVENSWLPGAELPAALATGHARIDFEHRQLLASMEQVRKVCVDFIGMTDCSKCGEATSKKCENDLMGVLGDLLSFVLDHFGAEEQFMRESSLMSVESELCRAHIKDHADISAKVQEIVMALDRARNVALLRELDVLLQRWMGNHIAFHDVLMAQRLQAACASTTVLR